jgi:putative transposase
MSRSKHTEAQMIGALKQVEAGRKVEDVAREVGVSKHTLYAWKAKYGGMDVSQAQEAKQLRDENSRLRKLVADLSLDKEALQSVIRKNGGLAQLWRAARPLICFSLPFQNCGCPVLAFFARAGAMLPIP